ncbi:MAG TPA: DOMON-like domain-containing protein [Steroidobacteraceae bacterium]|nr:DOMON-like domain-containing protein [Gammaproteobacteria bacterium]HEV2286604.1 DOMON-like domain-containing protein [Steroidobacteraceae bacterium]
MATAAHRALLLAHPDTPGEWVWSIAADVGLEAGTLVCHYALQGEVGRLRVPAVRAGRRADELWQHTCFEVFAAAAGSEDYYEFNFSPSLDWAAYHFRGYRAGMTPASLARAPGLTSRRTAGRLELTAHLHLEGLAALARAPRLRLGLTAVIEDEGGTLSYWALRHAPGNPDFHDPGGFALEIETA